MEFHISLPRYNYSTNRRQFGAKIKLTSTRYLLAWTRGHALGFVSQLQERIRTTPGFPSCSVSQAGRSCRAGRSQCDVEELASTWSYGRLAKLVTEVAVPAACSAGSSPSGSQPGWRIVNFTAPIAGFGRHAPRSPRRPVANQNADDNSGGDEEHRGGDQAFNRQIGEFACSIGRIPDVSPQTRTDP